MVTADKKKENWEEETDILKQEIIHPKDKDILDIIQYITVADNIEHHYQF